MRIDFHGCRIRGLRVFRTHSGRPPGQFHDTPSGRAICPEHPERPDWARIVLIGHPECTRIQDGRRPECARIQDIQVAPSVS